MARAAVITYAGFATNGTTKQIHGDISYTEQEDTATVEFTLVLAASTPSAFQTLEAEAVLAYRTPRADLEVSIGGQVRVDWTQAGNTGMDAVPSIRSVRGADWSSAVSGEYICRVTATRPADTLGQAYRRSSEVNVVVSPAGITTVDITGVYTAGGGNSATANYAAGIDAWSETVLTSAGLLVSPGGGVPSYFAAEERENTHTYVETDKVVRFSRKYVQLIAEQGPGPTPPSQALGSAYVVEQSIDLSVDIDSPGDGPPIFNVSTIRPQKFSCTWTGSYTSAIVENGTTIAPGSINIEWDQFKEDLIEWIVEKRILPAIDGDEIAMTTLNIRRNRDTRAMQITMAGLAPRDATGAIEYKRKTSWAYRSGKTLLPIWTGNPFSRLEFDGPASLVASVEETLLIVGPYARMIDAGEVSTLVDQPIVPADSRINRVVLLDSNEVPEVTDVGEDPNTIQMTDVSRSAVWEYYNKSEAETT